MKTTRTLFWLLALALLALVLVALPISTARAADPTIVRVKVNGATGGTCGGTWATSCGLQYALTSAVAPAELWVAKGTYTPTAGTDRTATFQLRNDIALYGGFMGGEAWRDGRNWELNPTILSGDIGIQGNANDNSYHVVTGSGVTNAAVLDGFKVSFGKANGTGGNSNGGGMYNDSGNPTVANVVFYSNSASNYGGGMYNWASSPTLTTVDFDSNTAAYSGGGMYNQFSGATLTDTGFYSNNAASGGGMYNYWYGSPTLTNGVFWHNTASYGGGMYNYNLSSPTLTNLTLISNTATYYGGGMENSTSGRPLLRNTTFVSNTAQYGGGMDSNNYSDATGDNTLFWGNAASTGSQLNYDSTSVPSLSYSVVQGGYAAGTHIITADPRLGSIGNWGGNNIPTIPILPGSSAIDAGNNGTCALTDQRGLPRVGICDIGAFEFQGYGLPAKFGDHQSTRINTPFANTLAVRLTELGGSVGLPGITVTFTAPSSGASAAWSGSLVVTATTDAGGDAVVAPPTANGIAGSYPVTITTSVATPPMSFTLTNLPYDAFLPLLRR